MRKDPIIEEVHEAREQILRECDYDMARVLERLRKHEKEHKASGRLVLKKRGSKAV